MAKPAWTERDVPDQEGRTAVVTGATSGVGFEVARILAERGATVVVAGRNPDKMNEAVKRINRTAAHARVTTLAIDLASQASVRRAAEALRARCDHIDILLNNAGATAPARRTLTDDGLEMTIATNHLGAFAFTGLLLDRLVTTPGSRVVVTSSIIHRQAKLVAHDIQLRRGYQRLRAYARAKLVNLMFALELHRRLHAAGAHTIALAAHPGISRTNIFDNVDPVTRFLLGPRGRWLTGPLAQDQAIGALSLVRAAVDPGARGGDFYGPPGRSQFTGYPERILAHPRAYDQTVQGQLWRVSERLTGIVYPFDDAPHRVAEGPRMWGPQPADGENRNR